MTTSRTHMHYNVKFILFVILAICALGFSPAYAQEDESGISYFDNEPSAEEVELELEQLAAWNEKQQYLGYINENREEVIADLVYRFAPVAEEGEDQEALTHAFEENLKRAAVEQLYEIENAADQGQVDAALGYDDGNVSPMAVIPTNANGDLIFTPVNPCRFMDTRYDSRTPSLSGNYAYYYWNYVFPTAATSTIQGGQTGGCSRPSGTTGIIAASLNMTTVPTGKGHIKVYPGGTSPPATSFLNYNSTLDTNTANSGIIRTDTAQRVHIAIWRLNGSGSQTAEVVGDVMGTFSQPRQIDNTMWTWQTSNDYTIPENFGCNVVNAVDYYHPGRGWVKVEFDAQMWHRNLGDAATMIETGTGCNPNGVNTGGYIPARSYFGSASTGNRIATHNNSRWFYYSGAGTTRYYMIAYGYPDGTGTGNNHYLNSRSYRFSYTPVR